MGLGHLVANLQLHWNLDSLSSAQEDNGLLFLVLFFDKLKIKEVIPKWDGELESNLSDCLTQAYTSTSKEGRECEGVALTTIRSCIVLTVDIESLRYELFWLLPLLGISLHIADKEIESITLAHIETGDSDISIDHACRRQCCRSMLSHGLLVTHLDIVKLIDIFKSHLPHDIVLDFLHVRIHLLSEPLFNVRVMQ